MSDDERKDVTIGVPAASAGAEPVGQDEDPEPESPEDGDEGEE